MDPLPKKLLIIDTETTGLDPSDSQCVEVGAILFSLHSRAVLAQQSFLLPVTTNDAEHINKIPAEISNINQPWLEGINYFNSLVASADLLVAHNASFDKKWFGIDPLPQLNKPWLCTMEDIPWSMSERLLSMRSRPSVRDLALAYEVPVWSAHRALTDCSYIAEVFRRCEELEKLILYGLEPRNLFRANVSYDERHLAKKAGFRWNDPIQGAWTKRLSRREASSLDFEVIEINPSI
mgnify:CR=1 FL=1